MRINIDLDEDLVAELMLLTGTTTRRQLVDQALRDQLRRLRARRAVLGLAGKVEWDGDRPPHDAG